MMKKNLARSFYILAKSSFVFFFQGQPLAWKSCGKIACLGVGIPKMPVAIQQSTTPRTFSWSTHSPSSLVLSVSVVREYGRAFWTRSSRLVGANRSWEMIFLAVMLNCLCSVGAQSWASVLGDVMVRLNNVSIFRWCYFVSTIHGLQTSCDVCNAERAPSVVLIVPGLIVD